MGVLINAHHYSSPIRILAAGRETAEAFKRLLELVHSTVQKPSSDNKSKLGPFSKEVADNVRELVAAAENIRGKEVLKEHCSSIMQWIVLHESSVVAKIKHDWLAL